MTMTFVRFHPIQLGLAVAGVALLVMAATSCNGTVAPGIPVAEAAADATGDRSFVARNPRDKAEVVWQLRQRFADGTVSDWTKGPNGVRSTSMTKLAPRPAQ